MKFRGIMREDTCISHFSKVVQTVAKMGKDCAIKITSEKFYFIQIDASNRSRCHMWCELEESHFFQDYCMSGVSEEQNEIYLEVVIENVVQALKLAQNAKSITIKLTKRHGASLTFEIDLPSLQTGSRLLAHDVPVILIQRALWEDYQEPIMPAYNISIMLPSLNPLKNVVDKIKNLDNLVIISANKKGNLKLQVETDTVTVTSTFTDHIKSEIDRSQKCDSIETTVDLRKLAQLLNCQCLSPNKIVCNIQTDRVVHFLLGQQGLTLQYFMPAIAK